MRKRKHDVQYPPRMRRKGRSLYYVRDQRWTKIGTVDDETTALANYRRLTAERYVDRSTVAGLAELYRNMLADDRNPLDLRESTRTEYSRQLQPDHRLVQVFGSAKLHQVKPHMIGDYLDRHPSPVAANREIALLSRMYRFAMRKGWADINPCTGISKNKERPRERYVGDTEYNAVHAIASPTVQLAMDIAVHTGVRLGDILGIRLKDYDQEELRVGEAKSGTKVRFSMTPSLYAVLESHKTLRGNMRSLYVVHTASGQRYTDSGFKSIWQRLQRKAMKDGVIKQRFTFHDIRAKHATDKDEKQLDAQLALGHSTSQMTKSYLRHPLGRKVEPLK